MATNNLAEGIKSLEGWKKNRTDISERQLGEAQGNVTLFKDKQIFGVLAGCVETSDTKDKMAMDSLVKRRDFLKWFEGVDFGPESIPFQASALSCVPADTDGPHASPGNGTATTTPAAMPRRVRQVAYFPVHRAQVPFHPRSLHKFLSSRPKFREPVWWR